MIGFNSSPLVVDGVVYVGCRDHNIYAIDAEHGFQRWRRTTGSTVDSSGAVTSGMLLIGSDDHDLWAVEHGRRHHHLDLPHAGRSGLHALGGRRRSVRRQRRPASVLG